MTDCSALGLTRQFLGLVMSFRASALQFTMPKSSASSYTTAMLTRHMAHLNQLLTASY